MSSSARAALPPNARAQASRINGAKSCGPKTPEGKARSARNALKHGLRAHKTLVLPGEDATEFQALETALIEELAPWGPLQTVLAQRIVAAAWRLARAERLEVDLFEQCRLPGDSLALPMVRDGHGSRSFDTLLRYRGGALCELWRALHTLKALQAEREVRDVPVEVAAPDRLRLIEPPAAVTAPSRPGSPAHLPEIPNEPKARTNPDDSGRVTASIEPETGDAAQRPDADRGRQSGA